VKGMRPLVWLALVALGSACAANDTAKLDDDIQQLKRRVGALEQKVKRLEGGKKGPKAAKAKGKNAKGKNSKGKNAKGKDAKGKNSKGKNAKGKDAKGKSAKGKDAKAKSATIAKGKGALTLEGDAIKVMVDNGKRKLVVPNTRLAPGEYTLMAAFEGETSLTGYGKVTVVEGKVVPVTCTGEPKSCSVGDPEDPPQP